jgi:hypothetical protein
MAWMAVGDVERMVIREGRGKVVSVMLFSFTVQYDAWTELLTDTYHLSLMIQ